MRNLLSSQFPNLQSFQSRSIPVANIETVSDDPPGEDYDNIDDNIVVDNDRGPDVAHQMPVPNDQETIPPEQRPLPMPSSCLENGHPLRETELGFRKDQAARYLKALREVIAEKSFQYSHVLQVAPSKAVRTRARSLITKLNAKIALYSRIYARCRMTMVRLGADERTLATFRILLREDVKASTAIRDPNQQGASSLRLSWIWQTGLSETGTAPDTLHECLTRLPFIDYRLIIFYFCSSACSLVTSSCSKQPVGRGIHFASI